MMQVAGRASALARMNSCDELKILLEYIDRILYCSIF